MKGINRELELALKKQIYKRSYHEFFKFCFKILFPSEHYEDSKHIEYLCNYLQSEMERIFRREEKDKDIIINIPPRSSKSLIANVCLVPWTWLHEASIPFIVVTFDDKLSMVNARLSRDIIRSDEFQELFGDNFYIRKDADAVGLFFTNRGGFRLSTTSGSSITGQKGTVIICLPGDQLIITDKGELTIKEIVENKLDVKVLSHNLFTDENEFKEIESYEKNKGRRLIKLKTESKEVIVTEDHLVWTENRAWVQAKDLTLEDELLLV